jgi:hypothetical protein
MLWGSAMLTAAALGGCSRPATPAMMPEDHPGQETCIEQHFEKRLDTSRSWSPMAHPLPVPDVIPALPPAPEDDNPYLETSVPLVPTPFGHSRLAIDPRVRPYRVNVPREYVTNCRSYRSVIQICVSSEGNVSSMDILRRSIPVIDLQLTMVVPHWRYHPYVVAGRPTPFCYVLGYVVR